MADSIETIVYDRLDSDGDLHEDAKLYVMAALDDTLDEVIEGGTSEGQPPRPDTPDSPAGAYLRRVSVTGFRGIGPPADLEVVPGPGLTLVVGANGTGKSSFAEGLEFLLTGRNSRWQGKSAEWRQGWRNLHAHDPPELQVAFAVDGKAEDSVVSRRWPSATTEEIEDHVLEGLKDLDWQSALETHRPFLSYDQLSDIVEKGPSARFDAMAAGLGLERLTDAHEQLRTQRLNDQRAYHEAREQRDELLDELGALDDERAYRVRAALADEPWNLERIHLVLEGVLDDGDQGEDDTLLEHLQSMAGSPPSYSHRPLDLLQRLATIEFPSAERVEKFCRKLHEMVPRLEAIRGRNAAGAALRYEALKAAMHVHEYDGDQPCPVCDTGHLDSRWKEAAETRLAALAEEAEEGNKATSELHDLVDECETLTQGPPDWLTEAGRVGIDASDVLTAWDTWESAATDKPGLPDPDQMWRDVKPGSTQEHAVIVNVGNPGSGFRPTPSESTLTLSEQGLLQVAGRLTERGANVREAVGKLRQHARAELDRRENLWRPLRRQLLEWLPIGRRGRQAAARLATVKAAADWLTNVEDDVRTERFRPIADRARRFWGMMGKDSSVALDDLTLTGQANRRHLEIATSVDGQDTPALAVMSQGELNALSLSLFLARALLPESPFRFLVIDDPVQAMDPTKVEGLARVLAEAAEERQVIVFTHDERLPAAVNRLRIEHRLLAVTRRENSQVQCQLDQEPVRRHLGDAHAVLRTDSLDSDTRRRVIPGFCRQALEAACVEAVWLARSLAGRNHAETERDVNNAQTLNDKLKLVLLDDMNGNHQDMRNALYQRFGTRARDVVDACNRGAHGHWHGGMDGLIDGTEWLTKRLLNQGAP